MSIKDFRTFAVPLVVGFLGGAAHADGPRTVAGLRNPESAAAGADGTVYVTVIGEREKKGDGSVAIVDPSGKITTFAAGLDDPHGLVIVGRGAIRRRRQERLEGRFRRQGRGLRRPRGLPPSPRLPERHRPRRPGELLRLRLRRPRRQEGGPCSGSTPPGR